MQKHPHARSTFSGKIGFVLSAAGASVGPVSYTHRPVPAVVQPRIVAAAPNDHAEFFQPLSQRFIRPEEQIVDPAFDHAQPQRPQPLQ